MIVPRPKLLLGLSFVLLPAAVLGAVLPSSALACGVACALAIGCAAVDAAVSFRMLRGIRAAVVPLVRLAKDRADELPIRIECGVKHPSLLRLGLVLPLGFESAQEDLWTALPAGAGAFQVAWKCLPHMRGRFPVSILYLECQSRAGLWSVRSQSEFKAELRVYPNLQTERHAVAPLLMRRNLGVHLQRQVGQGRDFEKLRDYVAGDPSDEVHWKASGKRGHLITKVFQVERTQEVYVIMDSSRLTSRLCAHPVTTVLERYVLSSLVMALATEQQQDLFGLVTFSDQIHGFVRARNGKAHYGACRDALLTLQPRLVNPDYDELCAFLRTRLRKRALLLFLTELDDPMLAENFVKNARLLARQHLVVVNMVQPPAAKPLFSNDSVNVVDDIYAELGHHMEWQRLRRLGRVLQAHGVRFSLLDADTLSLDLATQYLNLKQRQVI